MPTHSGKKEVAMKKYFSACASAVPAALLTIAVAAYAADPSPNPVAPSSAATTQAPVGPGAGPRRAVETQWPDSRDLPQILFIAAVNPRVKNDPEVESLLDKAIADSQVVQQDEAARLEAFQHLVQAERNGNAEALQKARVEVNSANVKLVADAKQLNQQDVAPLRKRIRELISRGGAAPEAGTPPAPHSAPASTN